MADSRPRRSSFHGLDVDAADPYDDAIPIDAPSPLNIHAVPNYPEMQNTGYGYPNSSASASARAPSGRSHQSTQSQQYTSSPPAHDERPRTAPVNDDVRSRASYSSNRSQQQQGQYPQEGYRGEQGYDEEVLQPRPSSFYGLEAHIRPRVAVGAPDLPPQRALPRPQSEWVGGSGGQRDIQAGPARQSSYAALGQGPQLGESSASGGQRRPLPQPPLEQHSQQHHQRSFSTSPNSNAYGPGGGSNPRQSTFMPSGGSPSMPGSRPISTYSHTPPNNSPLPAPPPMPLLDHRHLQPGKQAKLLDHARTLELYRSNARKTNDPELMFEFAVFMIEAVREMEADIVPGEGKKLQRDSSSNGVDGAGTVTSRAALLTEAIELLRKNAGRGHVASQFYLAECYVEGFDAVDAETSNAAGMPTAIGADGSVKGRKPMWDKALNLYVLAAKHGHVEAAWKAGQAFEKGLGCRKDYGKSVQWYRKAATAGHPAAMHRLGIAELNGELSLPKLPKDGFKWLKRAAELATAQDPRPIHELALLHERGIENVVFVDHDYAIELYARAAELGYAPSAYKLGECYEYGRMGCPQDAALSIHYYNIAAQQDHKEACFALTAWYLIGSPGVLPQSDTEAYLWAKKAAVQGLAKAEYAVGYFTEVGMGTYPDAREALNWFHRAREHGDRRAGQRIEALQAQRMGYAPGTGVGGGGDVGQEHIGGRLVKKTGDDRKDRRDPKDAKEKRKTFSHGQSPVNGQSRPQSQGQSRGQSQGRQSQGRSEGGRRADGDRHRDQKLVAREAAERRRKAGKAGEKDKEDCTIM